MKSAAERTLRALCGRSQSCSIASITGSSKLPRTRIEIYALRYRAYLREGTNPAVGITARERSL